eukprot:CAMPEP_0178945296 /NCGR_PEP_ID=MMETSP0789-20121207/3655_1 /TAXON_ID=3005 /ORGANISM="Rhizosolenia setigera, Strain CCMP 1694" /LENGTH=149 /DNA_ID=CAMNT_0020625169 /DNA_START=966 /DNA_END=1415 /DNA_ORIENTATION=-
MPIKDGLGGVSYLAGTCLKNGWIKTDGIDSDFKKYLQSNMTANALEAAKNLDRTVYFGLLEDIDRSMKMLQLTLGLNHVPKLGSQNTNKKKSHNEATNETISKIRSHIPGDLWLYEYAKLLFEARWNYMTGLTEVYEHPELPPFPDVLK